MSRFGLEKEIKVLKIVNLFFLTWALIMTVLILLIMKGQSSEIKIWEKQLEINKNSSDFMIGQNKLNQDQRKFNKKVDDLVIVNLQ